MPDLPNAIALWVNGNTADAMRQFVRMGRDEQESFAAAVLDSPQAITAAILSATLTVSPSEAAANENYDHNHDNRYGN